MPTKKKIELNAEAILAFLTDHPRLLDRDGMIEALKLSTIPQMHQLDQALAQLAQQGAVLVNRRGGYAVAKRADLIEGIILGHADGFGFLRPDGSRDDLYLSPAEMRQVMHGDRALVALIGLDGRGRKQGQVVQVIGRRPAQIVGRYLEDGEFGRVVPDDARINHDVAISRADIGDAKAGDIVVVEITRWPEKHRSAGGRISKILGAAMGPKLAIDVAIATHGLPFEFPAAVEKAAKKLGDKVSAADCADRTDLRKLPMVTIDGEDARDFDDAVYCETTATGYRLFVAIADVSHYVTPESIIDIEAQTRGTSVYFPNRVLPMLPEALSNGLCSLKPRVDRLALVCEMSIDQSGEIKRSKFVRAVIRSHARLTYNQVWRALRDGDAAALGDGAPLSPALQQLYALYHVLNARRQERGAIEFEGQEVRFGFDETGDVAMVARYERNDAHKLIEECMIAANVAAARTINRHKMHALNRVHAPPPLDRYELTREYLAELGVALPAHEVLEPIDLTRALRHARGRPDGALIETMLLRAQSLAVYSPAAAGHFGLALSAYAHFTSPIRRYPDLLVHRALVHIIGGGKPKDYRYSLAQMEAFGTTCSAYERRADDATREVAERLKCAWLEKHLGEEFDAIVTTVTGFGAFVELSETRISGLLHVTQLPNDYYHFDALRHSLVGERAGGVLTLADAIRVQVIKVDSEQRKIDFRYVGELPKPAGQGRGRLVSAKPKARTEQAPPGERRRNRRRR